MCDGGALSKEGTMASRDYPQPEPAGDETSLEGQHVSREAKEHIERARAEAASIVAAFDCPEDLRSVVLAHLGIVSESSDRQRQ